jgi:transposase
LYDIFCSILYIVKEGITWRALPHDYPKWEIVYKYFRLWGKVNESGTSLFEQAMNELVLSERIIDGRNAGTSMIIVDSKSVKNTDLPEEKGYDAGKKISGIKIHIGVDTNGFPHAIHAATANVTDRDGPLQMFEVHASKLTNVIKVLADGGYTGEKFADATEIIINAEVEIVKRSELHTFKVIPKRWIVERTFGWLEKCRRLWKNCERKLANTLQMTIIAFVKLLLNRWKS